MPSPPHGVVGRPLQGQTLDTEQATPVGADVRASRTIRMLGEEYLRDSIERGKKGSKTVFSQRGRENLRGQLAAMRKLAWRLGWLDRTIDPLDGLDIGRPTVMHGTTTQYVDPRLRPETRQVRAMADAADKLCGPDGTDPLMTRLPLFGTKIRVAGFGGLRLGEQNALRAIDAFFDRGYVHVNGSSIRPRGEVGHRGPVKNRVLHEAAPPTRRPGGGRPSSGSSPRASHIGATARRHPLRCTRSCMSHCWTGPSPTRSANSKNAKQSGVSTCHRVFGTQKCPTPGASCSTQSMSRRRLRSYPAASRIRAATLSVGDFRPRSYADIVACDVPDLAASSA